MKKVHSFFHSIFSVILLNSPVLINDLICHLDIKYPNILRQLYYKVINFLPSIYRTFKNIKATLGKEIIWKFLSIITKKILNNNLKYEKIWSLVECWYIKHGYIL